MPMTETLGIAKIRIHARGPMLWVFCPFDQAFLDRAKTLGGYFTPRDRSWKFPIAREEEVRQICREVFGDEVFDAATLRAERGRLLARIEEIDQQLRAQG